MEEQNQVALGVADIQERSRTADDPDYMPWWGWLILPVAALTLLYYYVSYALRGKKLPY
jgi:hypothetical protein